MIDRLNLVQQVHRLNIRHHSSIVCKGVKQFLSPAWRKIGGWIARNQLGDDAGPIV
jgi:hypothetical protein